MRYDHSAPMMHPPMHSHPMQQQQQKPMVNPTINVPHTQQQPTQQGAPAHVRGGTTYFYGPAVEPEPQAPPIQLQVGFSCYELANKHSITLQPHRCLTLPNQEGE
jgi:hypothetical protein